MAQDSTDKLNALVADARQARDTREQGYRQKALKMYPHICGRCAREFDRHNLHELTVHHRNHDHDDNPEDGSNWELLCVYCHDNEHQRQFEAARGKDSGKVSGAAEQHAGSTYNPFSDLKSMLDKNR